MMKIIISISKKAFFVCIFMILSLNCFAQPLSTPFLEKPLIKEMSIDQKRSLRLVLLDQMLVKYRQQLVFKKMKQYMDSKFAELNKGELKESPDILIKEALDRTRAVYEKVHPFVGNKFKRKYNPDEIEQSLNKFAWLKGPCFLILGIREEHKIALSFFYQPQNESLKKEFFQDAVQYSYPEVLNIPENQTWFENMNVVMERLGSKFFNVEKYFKQTKN